MTSSPRSLPLVALVIVVAVVGVNARLVAGGQTWADIRYHTEVAPPRLAAADAVQAGTLPAWWDGTGLGVPLAGEPAHGAMYPPAWFASTPRALDALAILHLVLAALGIVVWARRTSARRPGASAGRVHASEPAALVAGLLVATTGLLASTAMRGALPAIALLPWIGVCAEALADAEDTRARTRAAIGLGATLGLAGLTGELAGFVDGLVLVLVLVPKLRQPALLAAVAAGLAIASAQWLPALLHLAGDHAGARVSGLPLARLLELIVPGAFGSGDPERGLATLAGEHPWAPSVFVGAPLLALAAVRTPPLRTLCVLAIFALLAVVAGRGGWPHWLGAPEVHVAALVIVLARNAAAGIDALVAGERRAIGALAVGAACTTTALGALAVLRLEQPESVTAIERALLDGGLGVAAMAGAVVIAWRGKPAAWRTPVLLALLVVPTIGATPSTAPATDRALVDEPPAFAAAAERAPPPRRLYRPEYMFETTRFDPARPTVSVARAPLAATTTAHAEDLPDALGTLAGASGWKWGVAAARSEDPARPAIHDRVWYAAKSEGGALLDRYGIALAILPETLVIPRKLTEIARRGRWSLVALPVAPPASVMRGWSWAVAPDTALELTYPPGGGAGILRGVTVLRGSGNSRPDRGPPLPCTVEQWTPGAIDLACASDADGYAVVSSTAEPGWSVTVDGVDQPWVVADVLRRGVSVGAGRHAIAWRYRAPGLTAGIFLAAGGIALLVALGLASRRRVI